MINLNNLEIYKLAREIAGEVYEITKSFPAEEKYVLVPQLRRAAISIGANIAEGAGRNTKKDFHRFLFIALGSLNETRHHLSISKENVGLAEKTYHGLDDRLDKLGRMINLFVKSKHPNVRIHE